MTLPHKPITGSRGRWVRLALAVVPFVGMLVLIPAVNRTEPTVLTLPFLLSGWWRGWF